MLDIIRKLIRNESVPLVHLEGNDKVSKIQWVGPVQKQPNSVQDLFSLILWEIHSNPVEFFFSGKSLGWGYVGDIAGMTVDINRNIRNPPEEKNEIPDKGKEPEGLFVKALASRLQEIIPGKDKKLNTCPCVVIKGDKRIREIHFEYFQLLDDTAILDKKNNRRYTIQPDTKTDIIMPDGWNGTGYICDETGQTISITRAIKVMALVRDKRGIPVMVNNKPVEIEVGINWSGRLGQRSTNDKMTALWASAISGREKLIFGILAFIFGNLIGVVAHI